MIEAAGITLRVVHKAFKNSECTKFHEKLA